VIFSKLLPRLRASYAWKKRQVVTAWHGLLTRRGARAVLCFRWLWPRRPPFTRARLRLYTVGGGIGDELMATPIFREVRRRNPQCHITFVTRHPAIFFANLHLDAVEPYSIPAILDAVELTYALVLPPPRPLITLMAECLGLILPAGPLEPPDVTPTPKLRATCAALARPLIVVQPQASQWTPNKQWPVASWKELVRLLAAEFDVVEVGKETLFPQHDFGTRFRSLAGATRMEDFAWIISQATVFIGPVSGGMHFASAFRVRSVIIFGGYESPSGFHYPLMQAFYSPVPCAPCWLTTPCPYERKCLSAIRPEEVFLAVRAAALDPQWSPR
jgi:ADP-heptose:LPS heptosyltransferase